MLESGEAIVTGLTSEEGVHIRTVDGWAKVQGAGGWIVFTGQAAYEAASRIRQGPGPFARRGPG